MKLPRVISDYELSLTMKFNWHDNHPLSTPFQIPADPIAHYERVGIPIGSSGTLEKS